MNTITPVRELSWKAKYILKKLAAGCYVRRSHGTSFFVYLHEADGMEIDSFGFTTVNALEARGFAVRREFKKGWRWDITEQGRHQVEAWQQ